MKIAEYYSLLCLPEQRAKGKGVVLDMGMEMFVLRVSRKKVMNVFAGV